MDREAIVSEVGSAMDSEESNEAAILAAMQVLHRRLNCHWAGVYLLRNGELHLGPFVGPPTEHTRIAIGQGVCGTAVAEDANQIVRDVRERSNYLACNLETRSEIVVLVRDEAGSVIGQIDLDGTEVGQFDERHEALLEEIAPLLALRWP